MKETCSNIQIVLLSGVLSVVGNDITLASGTVPDTLYTDSLNFALSGNETDAGLSFSASHNLVIDKVDQQVADKYNFRRMCILIVNYSDGTHTVFGTHRHPVMAYIAQGVQRDTLVVALSTTVSPII